MNQEVHHFLHTHIQYNYVTAYFFQTTTWGKKNRPNLPRKAAGLESLMADFAKSQIS